MKAKDLLKAKFWTHATHQGLRKSMLVGMTAQDTLSTDAAQDGVVEVALNKKMQTMRYCKDKMRTVTAAHMVYIELGPKEPMNTIPVVLGGTLVAHGIPCIVYGPNAKARQHPYRRGSLYWQRGRRPRMRCTIQGKRTWLQRLVGLSSHALFCAVCCCNPRNSACILHTLL